MTRELHHRKKDDKYALWSPVADGYVTDWKSKEEIEQEWINDKIRDAIKQVTEWMEEIDKEV